MVPWKRAVNRFKTFLGLDISNRRKCERLLYTSNEAIVLKEQYLTLLNMWSIIDISKIDPLSKRQALGINITAYSTSIIALVKHLGIISDLIHDDDRIELSRFLRYNLKASTTRNLDSWLADENNLPIDFFQQLNEIKNNANYQLALFDHRDIEEYGWALLKIYDDLYAVSVILTSLLRD